MNAQLEEGNIGRPAAETRGLRILSYNIQAGIDTRRYREYVTKGWKHLLPNRERLRNLNLIADMLHGYDLVGLQEVDSGSLRSGFVDMTEYLAHRSGYPHWYRQVNRNIGVIAQHSNGFLSRIRPTRVSNHRLPPGKGRGAMMLEFPVIFLLRLVRDAYPVANVCKCCILIACKIPIGDKLYGAV